METPVIHTRWCGGLKLEVIHLGRVNPNSNEHAYTVSGYLGKAPLSVHHTISQTLDEGMNPVGNTALIQICNQFTQMIHDTWNQGDAPRVQIWMDRDIARVQLHNILCQNVEGILQPNTEPQWLITDREI